MITATQIPELNSFSRQDIRAWWDGIIELGLDIHPDDDLTQNVMIDTGLPSLDPSACRRLREIMDSIQSAVGELIYEIGMESYMANLGYVEGPSGEEWVSIERD